MHHVCCFSIAITTAIFVKGISRYSECRAGRMKVFSIGTFLSILCFTYVSNNVYMIIMFNTNSMCHVSVYMF